MPFNNRQDLICSVYHTETTAAMYNCSKDYLSNQAKNNILYEGAGVKWKLVKLNVTGEQKLTPTQKCLTRELINKYYTS